MFPSRIYLLSQFQSLHLISNQSLSRPLFCNVLPSQRPFSFDARMTSPRSTLASPACHLHASFFRTDEFSMISRRSIAGFSKPNFTPNKPRPAPKDAVRRSPAPNSARNPAIKKSSPFHSSSSSEPSLFDPAVLLFKQVRLQPSIEAIAALLEEAQRSRCKLLPLDLAEAIDRVRFLQHQNQESNNNNQESNNNHIQESNNNNNNNNNNNQESPEHIDHVIILQGWLSIVEDNIKSYAARELTMILTALADLDFRAHMTQALWAKMEAQLLAKKSLLTPALVRALLSAVSRLHVVLCPSFYNVLHDHLLRQVPDLSPAELVQVFCALSRMQFPLSRELSTSFSVKSHLFRDEEVCRTESFRSMFQQLNLSPIGG